MSAATSDCIVSADRPPFSLAPSGAFPKDQTLNHMGLNSTTQAAAEAGYHCTVVAELTATRNLPDGRGGVIPAATVQAANLAALRDRFAVVVETAAEIP